MRLYPKEPWKPIRLLKYHVTVNITSRVFNNSLSVFNVRICRASKEGPWSASLTKKTKTRFATSDAFDFESKLLEIHPVLVVADRRSSKSFQYPNPYKVCKILLDFHDESKGLPLAVDGEDLPTCRPPFKVATPSPVINRSHLTCKA